MVFSYKTIRKILCYKSVILYKLIILGMIFLSFSSLNISCIFATNTWLIKNKFISYIIIHVKNSYKLEGVWMASILIATKLTCRKFKFFIDGTSNLGYNNCNLSLYQCIFPPSCCYPRRPLNDSEWFQTN